MKTGTVHFSPWLYAVDVIISPLGTGMADAWRIDSILWLSTLLVGVKLIAWALFGMFIAGVSGLVGKR